MKLLRIETAIYSQKSLITGLHEWPYDDKIILTGRPDISSVFPAQLILFSSAVFFGVPVFTGASGKAAGERLQKGGEVMGKIRKRMEKYMVTIRLYYCIYKLKLDSAYTRFFRVRMKQVLHTLGLY